MKVEGKIDNNYSVGHLSDCAVHNEPAYRNEPCSCGLKERLQNTRYAIKFLEGRLRDKKELDWRYEISNCLWHLYEKNKYQQIWEEVKGRARGYRSPNLLFLIEELEQKYFPKEVKKKDVG